MIHAFLRLLSVTARVARVKALALALAAFVPFFASHAVVMAARGVGMPMRLGLDVVHGVIVLAYLGAALAIASGRGARFARMGFAVPRLPCLGFVGMLNAGAVIAVLGLPAALILHPLVQAVEAAQLAWDGWFYFPAAMMPEFVMTALIGLVLGAAARAETGHLNRHTQDD